MKTDTVASHVWLHRGSCTRTLFMYFVNVCLLRLLIDTRSDHAQPAHIHPDRHMSSYWTSRRLYVGSFIAHIHSRYCTGSALCDYAIYGLRSVSCRFRLDFRRVFVYCTVLHINDSIKMISKITVSEAPKAKQDDL